MQKTSLTSHFGHFAKCEQWTDSAFVVVVVVVEFNLTSSDL